MGEFELSFQISFGREQFVNRSRNPLDVLEFGEALIAARPQLRVHAEPLADSPDEANRLVEKAIKAGWRERRSFVEGEEVVSWLAQKLVVRH